MKVSKSYDLAGLHAEAELTQRGEDCEKPKPRFVVNILADRDGASQAIEDSKDNRSRLGRVVVLVGF
jgi:hypothetical protein